MSSENLTVVDDVVVSMVYQLKLAEGDEIERSNANEPLEYIQGKGQIIPGLESELYGMSIGDEKEVTVQPVDGYGEWDADQVYEVSRDTIPSKLDLEIGKPLSVKNRETGNAKTAQIKDIQPGVVVLDFNHPLAGKTLQFNVEIVGLRTASEEELSHKHVHHS